MTPGVPGNIDFLVSGFSPRPKTGCQRHGRTFGGVSAKNRANGQRAPFLFHAADRVGTHTDHQAPHGRQTTIQDPRADAGLSGQPGLSKHESVFRVPCARLFLSDCSCSSHIFHTLVQDRELCLKCYQGIQSPSGKFITTLERQARACHRPGKPFVFFFKKKKIVVLM